MALIAFIDLDPSHFVARFGIEQNLRLCIKSRRTCGFDAETGLSVKQDRILFVEPRRKAAYR